MPTFRKALGAGKWFPADPATLEHMVGRDINAAEVPEIKGRIIATIAPHAGYVYSGKVAGYSFRAARDNLTGTDLPETVVVLGFTHSIGFPGIAFMDGDSIETPLGPSALDQTAIEMLTTGRERLFIDYAPHEMEHSAENEIPFVQAAFPNAKLVVALTGDHEDRSLNELVQALSALAETKRILVVASTDMLHADDYELVSSTDRQTLERVAAMDIMAIGKTWSPQNQIFCGIMPVLAAMRFAEAQGCRQSTVLYYRNSGDEDPISRGHWVVGYGSVVFAVS